MTRREFQGGSRLQVLAGRLPKAAPRRKSVVTIGVFDGVHVGHKRILDEVILLAHGLGALGIVVTFDPHPVSVLHPVETPQMLTTLSEKLGLIAGAGLRKTLVLKFTPGLSRRRADWFVRRVLLNKLNMTRLVVGYDFRFGRGREGDARYLETLGEDLGFGVDIVPPVRFGGHPVSSTRIRTALSRGDAGSAAKMLGRPYSICGMVVRGEGRGRLLSYPTANLEVEDGKMIPREGIYAVMVARGRRVEPGVLYIGRKPTYRGEATSIEVHVLGRVGSLYGKALEVRFIERLRGDRAFGSDAALRRAIGRDIRRASRLLRINA